MSKIEEALQKAAKLRNSGKSETAKKIIIHDVEYKKAAEEKESDVSSEWVTIDSHGMRPFNPADYADKKPGKLCDKKLMSVQRKNNL